VSFVLPLRSLRMGREQFVGRLLFCRKFSGAAHRETPAGLARLGSNQAIGLTRVHTMHAAKRGLRRELAMIRENRGGAAVPTGRSVENG